MKENELRWMAALGEWRLKNPQPLADLLLNEAFAVPPDCRHFLSDLVLEQARRNPGRPTEYSGKVERSIAHDVFTEYEALLTTPRSQRVAGPQQEAWRRVADKRGSDFHAVRGVMNRLKKAGITFEWWKKVRPDWQIRI